MTKLLTGFLSLIALSFIGFHTPVLAEEFKAGTDYDLVNPPQPTQDPKKVEVLEFFWYGCPHCLDFEPDLNAWLKTKPQNVQFIRQPAVFNEQWAAHAKAFTRRRRWALKTNCTPTSLMPFSTRRKSS